MRAEGRSTLVQFQRYGPAMDRSPDLIQVNHPNALVTSYDGALEHFRRLFGAHLNMEIPESDGVRAFLMTIGHVILECFAPVEVTERGQGRLMGRYGDHYLGIEYRVADLAAARDALTAQGVRNIRDPGHVFFTHPADCFGVSFEIFEGDFYDPEMETINPQWTAPPPRAYWAEEHPMGILGLARWTVAVRDLDPAAQFYTNVMGADEVYREPRPNASAESIGLELGGATVELIAPTGEGPIQEFLERYGQHMRSIVYEVKELIQVEKYLQSKGVDLVEGDAPGSRAIPPEQNHGLLFEFTETRQEQ